VKPTASSSLLIAVCAGLAAIAMAGCFGGRAGSAPPTRDSEVYVARALEALGRGDIERARADLSLALEFDPQSAPAFNALGLVAVARGDDERAREHFRRSITLDADLAEAHSNLGALEIKAGRPRYAIEPLRAALAIDPGYPTARHNLARALLRLGNAHGARAELLKLTSAAADDADAWAELALADLALGLYDEAAAAVERALALDAQHPVATRAAGDLARARGDFDRALALYAQAIDRNRDDADALVGRGTTLLVLGKVDGAFADLDRAVRLAPRNAAARFAYGAAILQRGPDEAGQSGAAAAARAAIDQFDQAIALRRETGASYAEAHLFRAQAHEQAGDGRAALADYRKFIELAAEDRALAGEVDAARARVDQLESR